MRLQLVASRKARRFFSARGLLVVGMFSCCCVAGPVASNGGGWVLSLGLQVVNSLVFPPRRRTPWGLKPRKRSMRVLLAIEKKAGFASWAVSYERPVKSRGMVGPFAVASIVRLAATAVSCARTKEGRDVVAAVAAR